MNKITLILNSLKFYKRQHLAVLLATLISTAVLTGALIVGDSVKYSLKNLVELRLGKSQYALIGGDRFFGTELASELSKKIDAPTAALLMLQGLSINPDDDLRISKTQVIGINNEFWNLSEIEMPELNRDEVIISENTAQKLKLTIGDELLLRVQNADVIPLNTPFAEQEQASVSFRLKVKTIASDKQLGRFSLKSDQKSPYNVFVSHKILSKKLKLKGLANIMLIGKGKSDLNKKQLNQTLSETWNFSDAGLKIREVKDAKQWELISNRIFIDKPVSKAIQQSKLKNEAVLTYLVNSIQYKGKTTPYSFASAVSDDFFAEPLANDEIVINQWLADDLIAKTGDQITLDYFVIGPLRKLEEKRAIFTIKSIIPIQSNRINKTLMPEFPGMTEAGNCRDWDTGIPIDLDKIRDKDEDYWNIHRGTPKAFIAKDKGLEIWKNNFGDYTAFRFSSEEISKTKLEQHILKSIKPSDIGLQIIPVYQSGAMAANNSMDFGELFLSLSFFVIAAGILLTVLIYALNTQSRNKETGILSGLGYNRKQILKIRFTESIIVVLFGGILGALVGIAYNNILVDALNSVWKGAVHTDMLQVYIFPKTLFTGAISGIIIAFLVIYVVTRKNLKQPVKNLVSNSENTPIQKVKRKTILKILMILAFAIALFLPAYSIATSVDTNASLFLSAGGMFLAGAITWFYLRLHKNSKDANLYGISIHQIAFKNISRNRSRSIATLSLLALGTFSVIITGANRKTFYGTEENRSSGTGGFLFWAESSVPVLNDLNSEEGKEKHGLDGEEDLKNVSFVQFHKLEGDDASCLNLNQVQQPAILGLNSEELDKRKAFSFVNLQEGLITLNPWLILDAELGHNIYPAYADQTVITWGLIKKVGDTLLYHNEQGEEIRFVLMGGLGASVFQGHLLISEKVFTKHFPSVAGSKAMLIDAPKTKQTEVYELMETAFRNYGMEITPTSQKLAQFNTVTNTYLSVFLALGGLGMIIGTFGLGIVLLRNMLDRKNELAILKAIGYEKRDIFKIILLENTFLLLSGLIIGILAAFIGILPSLLSPAFTLPVSYLILLILAIFTSGMLWIYFPARWVIKGNLMQGLRNE